MHSDTWVATDALGRKLPTYDECGPKKEDRFVGMFYFITHNDPDALGPFNVSKIIAKNPENPKWGSGSHYWGEPEIGYYLNQEEWAIRRHALQLTDAGVDVIIIDVTNNKTYFEVYSTICKVFKKMRREGERTPDIAFLGSEISVNTLWEEFYSKGRYKDLWFIWKGKPLLLYGQHEQPQRHLINDIKFSEEIENFFTLKQSWAWTSLPWYEEGQDEWPWIDHYPQAISWHNDPSEKEMVPVAVAQHPLSNMGRSFHNFHQPELNEFDLTPVTNNGLFFQEQWKRALEVDPEFVFVTGWNEWSAGRQTIRFNVSKELQQWKFYPGAHLGKVGKKLHLGDSYFIDQYNQEYSRDIEPMKGGHTDNYYYQLMANIRKYKGVEKPSSQTFKDIDLYENFEQWEDIESIYYDHIGDTEHRHSQKQGNAGSYTDTKGRNDFELAKVAHNNTSVFFYIKTTNDISSNTDPYWMLLLIDTDQNPNTGWNGYDLLINNGVKNENTTSLKTYHPNKGWVFVENIMYKKEGNQLMLEVPQKIFKSTKDHLSFDFHWVDHPSALKTIDDLIQAGDNAPSRRANYRY
ncbi:hypothetical protein [Cellulophaga sp. Hel_I_12]|uniref:hypothetical protein n=1 Tax=Cellulophaga sp. Hel_I_12 TaxID=1249972 RepID=UPI00068D56B4|nr:hypothetical protein [Cellulophaga sp. Hel_I_12]